MSWELLGLSFWKISIVAMVEAELSMDASEETTAPKMAASTNQVMPGTEQFAKQHRKRRVVVKADKLGALPDLCGLCRREKCGVGLQHLQRGSGSQLPPCRWR